MQAAFAGRLKLSQVHCKNLAPEDLISNSSDPYFVLKFPNGEKYKSSVIEENLNPLWPKLTVEWDFNNLSMAQEFQLEVWDHDTIGVDDEIGCATFTLKDLAERHSHDDVPLVLILRTSKCSPAASRGTAFLNCYIVCPDIVHLDLFSADNTAIVRALNNMRAVAASSRFVASSNQYWDDNDRYQRVLELALNPSACADAATHAFLQYFFAAISPMYAPKLQDARKEQLKAAFDLLWCAPVSHKLLVLGIADRAHLLSPEFEAIIVARVADAFPPLLCSPAANDAALVKAMCQILKQNSVGIQAILSRPAALVVALEDFCLRAPFTEGPPLEVALLLCDVYRKSLPTDGQKLTRLFTPWVTDMAIPNISAVPLMNAYQDLKKMNIPFDEVAIFQNKPLPPRAFAYHFQIGEVPLIGACPQQLPPGGLAALPPIAPGTTVPQVSSGNSVQYFMPQVPLITAGTAEDDWCYSFEGKHITFVQEAVTQQPFTAMAAALLTPRAAISPSCVVMIWAADRLPDLADLVSFDSVDSAALFFSSSHPDYLHPAMYIDARRENSSNRFASAVSAYLNPTRYLVIRLRGTLPAQNVHQIQTIRVIGYAGADAIPAGPQAQLTAAIESRMHGLAGFKYYQHSVLVEPDVYPQQLLPIPAISTLNADRTVPGPNVPGDTDSTPAHPMFFVGQTYYPCYFSSAAGKWRPLYSFSQLSASKWTIKDLDDDDIDSSIVRNINFQRTYPYGHPYYHEPTYHFGSHSSSWKQPPQLEESASTSSWTIGRGTFLGMEFTYGSTMSTNFGTSHVGHHFGS